ncbi:MAG TPA: antitoxin [bacterium]|jgi:predicted DNA binding CopG/RHH family protein|nr:antitoxin [bacterium]
MKVKLDAEEKAILASYERGEWKLAPNQKEEKAKLQRYARATLKKDKRVNIRISEKDLYQLQMKALEEGMPYQTLMASVLHKFVNGGLISGRA